MDLFSPANGVVKLLENVDDEAFSKKILGDGIAVTASDGYVYAPVTGEISMIFPTNHALGIKSDEGLEILIHIGIDTVELNGKWFKSFVKENQHVKKGDLLVKYNFAKVSKKYGSDIILIITNSKDYSCFDYQSGKVKPGDQILSIK